jgi:hypothetical protein
MKKNRVAYNVQWEWKGKPETRRYFGTFKSMEPIPIAVWNSGWTDGHITITKITTIVEDMPYNNEETP